MSDSKETDERLKTVEKQYRMMKIYLLVFMAVSLAALLMVFVGSDSDRLELNEVVFNDDNGKPLLKINRHYIQFVDEQEKPFMILSKSGMACYFDNGQISAAAGKGGVHLYDEEGKERMRLHRDYLSFFDKEYNVVKKVP